MIAAFFFFFFFFFLGGMKEEIIKIGGSEGIWVGLRRRERGTRGEESGGHA
jgi:hypothetical protein